MESHCFHLLERQIRLVAGLVAPKYTISPDEISWHLFWRYIVVTDISDHFGIFTIILSSQNKYIATEPILFRSFKQENIIKFKTILADTEFTPSLETQCANTSYDTFINSYMGAYNYAFPKLNCKAQNKYRKHSPWITKGLIQSSITNQNF